MCEMQFVMTLININEFVKCNCSIFTLVLIWIEKQTFNTFFFSTKTTNATANAVALIS